jgi:hypoxanthine phosphoribosyltransferase
MTAPHHQRPAYPLLEDLERIVVDEEQLKKRLAELGAEISERYAAADSLTVISIINGALVFSADLIRRITVPVQLDCMRVSSYDSELNHERKPEIIDMLRLDLRDRHVLIVDDILDTGHTLQKVIREVRRLRPASVALAVLLEKAGRCESHLKPDFVGFTIQDEFVVGYGLDFAEQYRNLPCIGTVKAELQNPPVWR